MSWWGRTAWAAGAALVLLGACEEDTTLLGFRSPNPKLRAGYLEVPVGVSVMQTDSILTWNNPSFRDTKRYQVGQYNDPQLGLTRASMYSQFKPLPNPQGAKPGASALALELQLAYDYYTYGEAPISETILQVFELTDTLRASDGYNTGQVNYDPTPIGEVTFSFVAAIDTVIRIPIQGSLAQRLVNYLVENGTTIDDSEDFIKNFLGLAILPTTGNTVFGINPAFKGEFSSKYDTKLVLKYDDLGTTRLMTFVFDQGPIGFTSITADRSGTVLSGIPGLYQPYLPPDGKAYVQAGTGLVTRLDFADVLAALDTLPAKTQINAFEIYIGDISFESSMPPPEELQLRLLNADNTFRISSKDSLIDGRIQVVDNDTLYYPYYSSVKDIGHPFRHPEDINYNGSSYRRYACDVLTDNAEVMPITLFVSDLKPAYYQGFFTNYGTTLTLLREDKKHWQYRYYALLPKKPVDGKSVNRVGFGMDKVKAKVRYVVPLTEIQE
jgi:hypothetical protein